MSANDREDVDGNHPITNVDTVHLHFNVLKVLRNAKQEFEAKNPGKIAAFCYAPEPLLYLVDRAIKVRGLNEGTLTTEQAQQAHVTNVFGMELISVGGTCLTITAEAIHTNEDLEPPLPVIIPQGNGQPN